MISPTHGRLELVRASDFARIANEFDQARAERDQARSLAAKLRSRVGGSRTRYCVVSSTRPLHVWMSSTLEADITAALEVEA